MHLLKLTFLAILLEYSLGTLIDHTERRSVAKSRHKRYVAFPEGSTFIVSIF